MGTTPRLLRSPPMTESCRRVSCIPGRRIRSGACSPPQFSKGDKTILDLAVGRIQTGIGLEFCGLGRGFFLRSRSWILRGFEGKGAAGIGKPGETAEQVRYAGMYIGC